MTNQITVEVGQPNILVITDDTPVTELVTLTEPAVELSIVTDSKAPTEIISIIEPEDEIQVIVGGNIGAPGPPGPQGLPGGATYIESFPLGTGNTVTVTHNLGELDVLVQLYRESDGVQVGAQITRLSIYQVRIHAAFNLEGYKVIIFATGSTSGGGGPSGPISYIHTQASLSTVWTVTHDLGYYPAVTAVDGAGSVIYGSVQYLTINTLRITFNIAITGKAYCS